MYQPLNIPTLGKTSNGLSGRSILVLISIGFHGILLALPLVPEAPLQTAKVQPTPQKVAVITSPKPSPTPASTPKVAVSPSPSPKPSSTPLKQNPPREQAIAIPPKVTTFPSPNPAPSPSPKASPNPSPNLSPSPYPSSSPEASPSPSPAPVSFAGEVFGELGASPGCNGKAGCWQVQGNWRLMINQTGGLLDKLRSNGYTITPHRTGEDFMMVYALAKDEKSQYLYILNSPILSEAGTQEALTLITEQGDLSQSEVEMLAIKPKVSQS